MNPLRELEKYGQAIWLDYIRRKLITSGQLSDLVEKDGLSGITSNPTIFEKAIAGSNDYDEAIRAALKAHPDISDQALFEKLAVEDIQKATDILRPVFDKLEGVDGFVSIEVAPKLAHDTEATIAEARRLWKEVNRPNLFIKVPATAEGIPAIEALLAEGINVNITLMFSIAHYEAVSHAYLRGLDRNPNPQSMASVASFFVSRVDTLVDHQLDAIGTPEALALRGKIGIANCKRVYNRFREIFYGQPFAALKQRGARVQRPLWASTSTKNPAYSDVMYVEELIGPDTVNTLPPATINAFRDHGQPKPRLEGGLEEAEAALSRLDSLGVDLHSVGEKLQSDGVAGFQASYDKLMASLQEKRRAILAGQLDRQYFFLGATQAKVDQRTQTWQTERFAQSLWAKDYNLWSSKPVPEITNRLGWLTLPELMQEHLDDLVAFAKQVRDEDTRHVVLLGMGGSSLAPEVFQRTFGNSPGFPKLQVLDSTHPDAVRAVEESLELPRTLFLVSSKSGTTMEMLSFFRYFWKRMGEVTKNPGQHFAAVTDPGTPLETLARERKFRRFFSATPDVGGRYSALTAFGLVPAALIGMDVHGLLHRAWRMAEACASCVLAPQNPGLTLGAALGELTLAGYDKVTFHATPSFRPFSTWLEQLIAESTGKEGKGIVPVADETLGMPEVYGSDRLFVYFQLEGDGKDNSEAKLTALNQAGFPLVRIRLPEMLDLGQEFFRWEVAIAASGAALGIHPFNQPDVELAKQLARQAMAKGSSTEDKSVQTVPVTQSEELHRAVSEWLGDAEAGDYVALQAYLPPTAKTADSLSRIRETIRERTRLATTCGYGPRFLHSTGQLHKGGPNTGLFLQIVDDPSNDLAVPEADYTFGRLIRAQAVGDYQALIQRGRRVLRVSLGRDVAGGLTQLGESLRTVPIKELQRRTGTHG